MQYTTKIKILQTGAALLLAGSVLCGAALHQPRAEAVQLPPEAPAAVGAMLLRHRERPSVRYTHYVPPVRSGSDYLTELAAAKLQRRERARCENAAPEEPERRYLGTYKITGYTISVACCGKDDGITASGAVATVGRTCAAPRDVPFGTVLWIDGLGERVVEDRGGFGSGVIDVLCEDVPSCYAITSRRDVWIVG